MNKKDYKDVVAGTGFLELELRSVQTHNEVNDGNSAMVLTATVFTLIGKFAITGSFSTIFMYTPELYPTNMRKNLFHIPEMQEWDVISSGDSGGRGMLAPFSRNF
ncbi:hypothetical protein MAR_024130, partial [Mya arenaria]